MKKITDLELAQMTQKIVDDFQPEKVVVFGSYAWGAPHEDSDIDLFIIKDSADSSLNLMREVDRILFDRTVPVDVVVYTQEQYDRRSAMQDPFIQKVNAGGKVLYER